MYLILFFTPFGIFFLVTKNRPQSIIKLLIDKGYSLFGENRVQEADEKFSDLEGHNI